MKITKSKLKQFIKEGYDRLAEEDEWPDEVKKGRFTSYCKREGFDGPGIGCSEKAMDSDDASVRGMASFYMNTVKPKGKDASDVAEESQQLTKQTLQEYIKEILAEVTAGAEKFADFEEIAQAYRADKTDRKAAQEMAYYIEDVVSPEMENLGLRDTATDSAKGHGLFDWSAREGEDYKNVSIDLYGDGYEIEVYPSSNDDDMQTTTTDTLMDAINFVRGVLSPQGAGPAPGEDPAQMELPLEEYEKVPGGGDYADEEEEYEVSDDERWDDEEDEAYADDVAGYNEPPDYDLERFGLHRQKGDLREGRLPTKNLKIKIARKKK